MVPTPYNAEQLDPREDALTTDASVGMSGDEPDAGEADLQAARAEIEQTRTSMAETLEAIKDKLDPHAMMTEAKNAATGVIDHAKESVQEVAADVVHKAKETIPQVTADAAHNAVTGVVHEAKEAVDHVVHSAKDAVGGAMGSARGASESIMDALKAHPLPFALGGLGLGWLFKNQQQNGSSWRNTRSYRADYIGEHGNDPSLQTYSVEEGHSGSTFRRSAQGAGENMMDSVKNNPIPFALIGLGLGMLCLNSQQKGSNRSRDYRADYPPSSNGGSSSSGAGQAVSAVQERAGEVAGQVRETAGQFAGQVQERAGSIAGQVQSKAGEVANEMQYSALKASYRAQETAGRVTEEFQHTLQQNPIAVGVVALGVGLAVGLLVPETPPENRLMGEHRDRLVGQVQQSAQDLTQKVQTVAKETLGAVANEVKEQGLTPQGLGEKVQAAAMGAVETAKQTAKEQGLPVEGLVGGAEASSSDQPA
jgi:hypothetical protein